jgi:hypothetical protein
MVKLQEILLRNVERLRIALGTLSDARLKELPRYRERFRARVPDPGDMLRY